jgi:hypothetical protein
VPSASIISALLCGLFAEQQGLDDVIDIGHGFEHTFAEIAAFIAVAQLQCLAGTGGGAGGCASAADHAGFQNHFRHHRGIATGIQDFKTFDINNFTHGSFVSIGHTGHRKIRRSIGIIRYSNPGNFLPDHRAL